MANSFVQFRADETTKTIASDICEKLGMDLPTYLRICMVRLVQENGIPFSMKLDEKTDSRGMAAMRAASRIAEENGIADMTLDEINDEINAARR